MTDWNAISAFMGAVVAWPGPSDPGYINLQYSYKDKTTPDGKRAGKYPVSPGKPFTELDKLLSHAGWINTIDFNKDVWFCTSRQARQGLTRNGKPKAIRSARDALFQKSIWIDIDVGPDDPKKYATVEEALAAILLFQKTVKLPPPSAIVFSGSGIHVYWISKTPLTPAEWGPYALGLRTLLLANTIKCDSGLTTDIARILRVPGTFNYKYDPPKPVQLSPLPLVMYDFAKLDFLKQCAAPMAQPHARVRRSIFAEGPDIPARARDSFTNGPHPAFAHLKGEPGLEGGIHKHTDTLLDPRPIFSECGFYQDAFASGGKDHKQDLWMYAVLGTTFMDSGRFYAHEISKGHLAYTPADTDAMFDRKMGDRHDKGLGYPKCSTIQGAGCKSCATCPLLANGKSPLNLGIPNPAHHTDDAAASAPGPGSSLPPELKFSLSDIPPHRQWLYGVDLVRGDLSVLASTGGAGKTSLAVGMAISLASGNSLLGSQIWGSGPLTSLYINAEDSGIEMRRRALAFCQQHHITALDRLFIAGTEDLRVRGLSFLRPAGQNSSVLDEAGLEKLHNLLATLRPDLVVIDPLIALCGGGNVNDNAAMALVMREIKRLAIKFNCSILIVHHTRKGGEPGSADAISGASAIKDLARCARMPVTMTTADMLAFSVLPSERLQYFKLVDAKSNLALHSGETWYKLESQELPNAGAPYPHGDRVQAVVRVQLSVQPGGSASADDMKIEAAILAVVDRGKEIKGQRYPYSPSLAGANNERALLPDAMDAVTGVTAPRQWLPDDLKAVTNAAIKKMKADGRLVDEAMKDLAPKTSRFRRARGLKAVTI
jgi:hypothetical protein